MCRNIFYIIYIVIFNEDIKNESKLCIPIYYFDFDYENEDEDEDEDEDEYEDEYKIPKTNTSIINKIDFENLNFRCKNSENCILCMYYKNCKNCTLCKFSSSLINCNDSQFIYLFLFFHYFQTNFLINYKL